MAKQIAVIYAVSVIIVCRYSLHYTNSHLEVGISLHLLAQMFLLLLLLFLVFAVVVVVVAVVFVLFATGTRLSIILRVKL